MLNNNFAGVLCHIGYILMLGPLNKQIFDSWRNGPLRHAGRSASVLEVCSFW